MSDNTTTGCLVLVVIIVRIAAFLAPGFLAWHWIDPDSFGSTILFLFVWSILGYVAQFLVFGLAMLFMDK